MKYLLLTISVIRLILRNDSDFLMWGIPAFLLTLPLAITFYYHFYKNIVQNLTAWNNFAISSLWMFVAVCFVTFGAIFRKAEPRGGFEEMFYGLFWVYIWIAGIILSTALKQYLKQSQLSEGQEKKYVFVFQEKKNVYLLLFIFLFALLVVVPVVYIVIQPRAIGL